MTANEPERQGSSKPGVELEQQPPADLREAIARALWARSDLDREENPDQFGKDGHRAFWYGQAEAVLPIVEAHAAAEVESYRLALATLVEGLSPDQRCACEDCQVEQVEIERVWTFARDVLLDGKLDVPARLRAEGSADALAAVADVEQHRPGNPEVRAGWVGACAALRAELNSMAGGVH